MAAPKAGAFIRLPDGREGTVVYHGLDGVGIMFGRIEVDIEALHNANPVTGERPADWPYDPEAMLREKSEWSAKLWPGIECVGTEYEVLP